MPSSSDSTRKWLRPMEPQPITAALSIARALPALSCPVLARLRQDGREGTAPREQPFPTPEDCRCTLDPDTAAVDARTADSGSPCPPLVHAVARPLHRVCRPESAPCIGC